MNKKISKVAVLGSGIMGSGIACHFANIGVEVLLLDILNPNNEEIKESTFLRNCRFFRASHLAGNPTTLESVAGKLC